MSEFLYVEILAHVKCDQVLEVNLACLVTKVLLQSVEVEFEFD